MGAKFLFLRGCSGSLALIKGCKDWKLSIVGLGVRKGGKMMGRRRGAVGDGSMRDLDISN
jgi:hypothetical protein